MHAVQSLSHPLGVHELKYNLTAWGAIHLFCCYIISSPSIASLNEVTIPLYMYYIYSLHNSVLLHCKLASCNLSPAAGVAEFMVFRGPDATNLNLSLDNKELLGYAARTGESVHVEVTMPFQTILI